MDGIYLEVLLRTVLGVVASSVLEFGLIINLNTHLAWGHNLTEESSGSPKGFSEEEKG